VCIGIGTSLGLSYLPNVIGMMDPVPDRSNDTVDVLIHLNGDIRVPECVEVGDLMLLDTRFDESNQWTVPGLYNEHGGIYIGNNTLIDAGLIHDPDGVYAYDYSTFYSASKNFVFLRVKGANESQRYAAAAWAESKIGTPYQNFFSPPWFGLKIADTNRCFPTADKFYCMELLWASYYNQGVDIDQNGWRFPWWVKGDDILHDDDVEIIYEDISNSTEITSPYKGIYVANKKIVDTLGKTIIFGNIIIEAVTDNENVTHMDLYIDSIYRSTDATSPYQWIWNEPSTGEVVIKVIAYDNSDNQYSTTLTVWKIF
jgi:hypothetical protein